VHYLLIALAPKDVDAVEHIERNLADYVDYLQTYNGRWSTPDGHKGFTHDYWLVGGRWTGWLTGYKPCEDPANRELCAERFEGHPKDCARCKGTGFHPKWPFFWVPYYGDVGTVEQALAKEHPPCAVLHDDMGTAKKILSNEHLPYALLTEDGVWINLQERSGEEIIDHTADMRAALEARRDLQAVVVDCHR
jgi:hypothetical protein